MKCEVEQLEQALQEIKQRLAQVRTMQSDRIQLESQQQEIRDRLKHLLAQFATRQPSNKS
ncbi:MAG: hypothetical protein HC856_05065 [Pseudanabaena sp. RU_4_16]|nr:hypothetical protein [Pseudanabaena sp. RU_4_16]